MIGGGAMAEPPQRRADWSAADGKRRSARRIGRSRLLLPTRTGRSSLADAHHGRSFLAGRSVLAAGHSRVAVGGHRTSVPSIPFRCFL